MTLIKSNVIDYQPKNRYTKDEMNEHILIVEDEEDILELVRFNLEKKGYHVSAAATGELGLDAARTMLPELIILDLMLPGIHGLEVGRWDERGGGGAGRRVFADIGSSLVIIFDIYKGVTDGDATKSRRNEAKIRPTIFKFAHKLSGSRFAGCSLVCKSFSKLSL